MKTRRPVMWSVSDEKSVNRVREIPKPCGWGGAYQDVKVVASRVSTTFICKKIKPTSIHPPSIHHIRILRWPCHPIWRECSSPWPCLRGRLRRACCPWATWQSAPGCWRRSRSWTAPSPRLKYTSYIVGSKVIQLRVPIFGHTSAFCYALHYPYSIWSCQSEPGKRKHCIMGSSVVIFSLFRGGLLSAPKYQITPPSNNFPEISQSC